MKRIILLFTALTISALASAELRIPTQFGEGMVLQQKTDAAIWGWASAGSKITVKTSWNKKSCTATAGQDGRWEVKVATPGASYTPYTIQISGDGTKTVINDVLIGEVWLASGQSNMEMPMRGFFNCPVEGAADAISAAPLYDKVRMYTALTDQSYEPREEIAKTYGWQKAGPETIADMSAVAFYFARKINQTLDVPVGIVSFAYGGARVESWLPEKTLREWNTEDLSKETIEATQHYTRPFLMYNAMEQPLKGYTGKGFIWYQGCSNVGHHDVFVERMQELVRQWRSDWGDATEAMPFLMVEIAPYIMGPEGEVSNESLLRQAQHEAAKAIKNSGIIVTNDLVAPYEQHNIHPCKKEPVGNRLAFLALKYTYGFDRIAADSPEAIEIVKDTMIPGGLGIKLSNCPNGLDRSMGIQALEISGADNVWVPVEEAFFDWEGRLLHVRAEGVAEPCQVRYGWGEFNPGNLHNCEGLPVAPFWLKLED